MILSMASRVAVCVVGLAGLLGTASGGAEPGLEGAAVPQRVVSLGGSVTELVYALHGGEVLVAADDSSIYPAEAHRLPKVGYYRSTPVEGVAALRPDLILASSQAGPEHALTALAALGIPLRVVPDEPDLQALQERIRVIAQALGREARGQALIAGLQQALEALPPRPDPAPRTVFLMQRGGRWMAAGTGTAAHATMTLAGLHNAVATQGYQAVSAESLAALAPELVVTTHMSVAELGGEAGLRQVPGLGLTPALKQGRVIVMEDLLILGFGPRLPEALAQLREGAAHGAP